MATILVFGKSGQLASAVRAYPGLNVVALGRADVDITSINAVRAAIRQWTPDFVINAAAYTLVDKAETERESALALNVYAAEFIAIGCAEMRVPLVHISSDYVFDGQVGAPYGESHATCPVNFYGESKALGEQAVLAAGGYAAVVRTSWVFSAGGSNFVRTMLRLAATRPEIGVVGDQFGRPTAAGDLAEACLVIGGRMAAGDGAAGGIFHFSNTGRVTWAEFATSVMQEAAAAGLRTARIRTITTPDYPTPAKRPRDSTLATGRIEAFMGKAPRAWAPPLSDVVRTLSAL